jgi:AraC-like DNA-binding protein
MQEPFREQIQNDNIRYPLRIFRRSSMEEYVFVHPHWHDEFEILLVLKGSGSQQIGPHVFPFAQGDILPIPCGAVHSTYTDQDQDNEMLVFTFPWDFPAPGLLSGPELRHLNRFRDGVGMPVVIHETEPDGTLLADLLLRMEREKRDALPGWELMIRARLLEWAMTVMRLGGRRIRWENETGLVKGSDPDMRAFQDEDEVRSTVAHDMLRKVFDWIDREYAGPLRVKEAARTACLSVSQLERLFRAHTGRGFLQYLNRYRILKACERIPTGESLTQIALGCGFGSLSSFSRAFRRVRGMAPSALRRGE